MNYKSETMIDIELFISKIENFNKSPKIEQIDVFAYILTVETEIQHFSAKDIGECFEQLNLPPYSNISAYLLNNSKHKKGQKYIKHKEGYSVARYQITKYSEMLSRHVTPPPTDNLFPKEILDDARNYIKTIAFQAMSCFDYGLFDAASVMLRKLIEVLIIELFERYKIAEDIKNEKTGEFYFLGDLVAAVLNEKTWTIGRNAKEGFVKIKKMGDMSAHNRRYFSKRPDIIAIQDSIRECVQELIVLIDYPTWNKEISK